MNRNIECYICGANLVKLRNCITDLCVWLKENFLMLNGDKTLFTTFGTLQQCAKLGQMEVGERVVDLSKEVKHLGVTFDQHLIFKSHIMAISKGAYF